MNVGDRDQAVAALSIPKRPYTAPELVEHGDIHTLVHRRFINGADGGLPVDNDS